MQKLVSRLAAFGRRFHLADIAWTDRWLGRSLFHPTFWVTRRIRQAVQAAAPSVRGRLLDAGCGNAPYRDCFSDAVTHYIGLECHPRSGYRGNRANLYGNLYALPLKDGVIDAVLCTEVLEHIDEPDRVLKECWRVMRPGAVLVLTAPFVFPVHEEHDYFRYTKQGLQSLLQRRGFKPLAITPLSGAPLTLAILFGLYVYDGCFLWNRWLYWLSLPLRPFLLVVAAVVNALGGIAEHVCPSYPLPFNHMAVAERQANGVAASLSAASTWKRIPRIGRSAALIPGRIRKPAGACYGAYHRSTGTPCS